MILFKIDLHKLSWTKIKTVIHRFSHQISSKQPDFLLLLRHNFCKTSQNLLKN